MFQGSFMDDQIYRAMAQSIIDGEPEEAEIIAVSALLTTMMVKQRDVVEPLDDIGLRPVIKVMVAGAPVRHDWAEQIGADGFGEDAVGAEAVAKVLLVAKALQRG
jgi:methanogenic corrinoid protein MtbC1